MSFTFPVHKTLRTQTDIFECVIFEFGVYVYDLFTQRETSLDGQMTWISTRNALRTDSMLVWGRAYNQRFVFALNMDPLHTYILSIGLLHF